MLNKQKSILCYGGGEEEEGRWKHTSLSFILSSRATSERVVSMCFSSVRASATLGKSVLSSMLTRLNASGVSVNSIAPPFDLKACLSNPSRLCECEGWGGDTARARGRERERDREGEERGERRVVVPQARRRRRAHFWYIVECECSLAT